MCLYLPAETAPRQTDRPVGRVERGYLVVEFLGTSCGSCNHSEAQTDLVVSWRFCCVIQKAWPRGKSVAGQMLGISALGCKFLLGLVLAVQVWEWQWFRRPALGDGGGCVVRLPTPYAVGQRPPRYRRHPAQDLSASKGPPRSIAPRCETTGSTPRRRLTTQLPAGVHFHPCLPSPSVLTPKVSPSHGKERRERRKQELNSRVWITRHHPAHPEPRRGDARGDVRFEYRAS